MVVCFSAVMVSLSQAIGSQSQDVVVSATRIGDRCRRMPPSVRGDNLSGKSMKRGLSDCDDDNNICVGCHGSNDRHPGEIGPNCTAETQRQHRSGETGFDLMICFCIE